MNFLRKYFGLKPNEETTPSTSSADSTVQDETPSNFFQSLFSDHQPPVINPTPALQKSKLQDFLGLDFSNRGFGDGYEHHSTELLDRKILIYKAEFRQIIDETIDNRKQEVFKLRNQLIETRGLPELVEQLELRISELRDVICKLEKEKELSAEDEGMVMKSIHQYREGFLRGCKDWHEAKLFAQSTGIF